MFKSYSNEVLDFKTMSQKIDTKADNNIATSVSNGLMSNTDKAKLDGLSVIATSGDYKDIQNPPTSLPANGGNADTVGGKSVEEFASKTDISNLGNRLDAIQQEVSGTRVALIENTNKIINLI